MRLEPCRLAVLFDMDQEPDLLGRVPGKAAAYGTAVVRRAYGLPCPFTIRPNPKPKDGIWGTGHSRRSVPARLFTPVACLTGAGRTVWLAPQDASGREAARLDGIKICIESYIAYLPYFIF